MRLCYLGPEATNTHEAALRVERFLKDFHFALVPMNSVPQVIRAVNEDPSGQTIGCVPLENSIQGSVTPTWDTLGTLAQEARSKSIPDAPATPEGWPFIEACITLPIEHRLLVPGDADWSQIETIYSHPQALAQCQVWLESNLPGTKQVAVASTADAAQMVSKAQDKSVAAIGPIAAASVYQLTALDLDIQTSHDNKTRFGLVFNRFGLMKQFKNDNRSELTMSLLLTGVANDPGGLLSALMPFQVFGLNITRIESRPVGQRLGDYLFYLDVGWGEEELPEQSIVWKGVQEALRRVGMSAYLLGVYAELCE